MKPSMKTQPENWKPYVCVCCEKPTRLGPSYVGAIFEGQRHAITPSICMYCYPDDLETERSFAAPASRVSAEVRKAADLLEASTREYVMKNYSLPVDFS